MALVDLGAAVVQMSLFRFRFLLGFTWFSKQRPGGREKTDGSIGQFTEKHVQIFSHPALTIHSMA